MNKIQKNSDELKKLARKEIAEGLKTYNEYIEKALTYAEPVLSEEIVEALKKLRIVLPEEMTPETVGFSEYVNYISFVKDNDVKLLLKQLEELNTPNADYRVSWIFSALEDACGWFIPEEDLCEEILTGQREVKIYYEDPEEVADHLKAYNETIEEIIVHAKTVMDDNFVEDLKKLIITLPEGMTPETEGFPEFVNNISEEKDKERERILKKEPELNTPDADSEVGWVFVEIRDTFDWFVTDEALYEAAMKSAAENRGSDDLPF